MILSYLVNCHLLQYSFEFDFKFYLLLVVVLVVVRVVVPLVDDCVVVVVDPEVQFARLWESLLKKVIVNCLKTKIKNTTYSGKSHQLCCTLQCWPSRHCISTGTPWLHLKNRVQSVGCGKWIGGSGHTGSTSGQVELRSHWARLKNIKLEMSLHLQIHIISYSGQSHALAETLQCWA